MSARAPAAAKGLALGGALASVGLVVLLMVVARVPWADAALLATLLVLIPTLAVAQLPAMEEGLGDIRRLPAYLASAVTIGTMAALCWVVGTWSSGPAALGLVAMPARALVLWTVLLAGAGLGTIVVFRQLAVAFAWPESDLLRLLLPRTAKERAAFAFLSLVAGFGEEIAYRGYAITVLAGLMGGAGAAVLTSAVFGVMHAYQGPLGLVRTAVLGGVLAGGFLATGSLWPPVCAHALIDLVAGIVLGERLLVPVRGTGVREDGE